MVSSSAVRRRSLWYLADLSSLATDLVTCEA